MAEPKQTKLLAFGQRGPAKVQITQPCTDCPLRRTSLPGWLGGSTPAQYLRLLHSDALVPCHCHGNVHCAGVAIYRANTAKRVEFPGLKLAADRDIVFDHPEDFSAHHTLKGR